MSVLRRSGHLCCSKQKVDDHVVDQLDGDQILESKLAKSMVDHLDSDKIDELNEGISFNHGSGSGMTGLYPQIIIVQVGEDVANKIMSFSGNGWAVCILSAIGAVSNVTVRASASFSPQTITYEGRFEILSLSGSYVPIELDGVSTGTGGLNIILSSTDGRLLSGGVAGPLIAASPVQVVIGRFQGDDKKQLGQAGTTETMGAMNGGSHGELRIVPN